MQFYQELETILQRPTPKEKIEHFQSFYEAYKKEEVDFKETQKPIVFKKPSYSGFCRVVRPKEVPNRRNLASREGKAFLVHAVAHIEYSAIDLALDICYRFRGMPKEFYDDWLEVADDEVRHFLMLGSILDSLEMKYGDVPVHSSLFESSMNTAHSLLERLAVVPRYLEANGLDATPAILQRLQSLPEDEILHNIKSALHIILQEEVEHVRKGDKWFGYVCKEQGREKEDAYIEIISCYFPQGFERLKSLNKDARLQAGFSCSELKRMTQRDIC